MSNIYIFGVDPGLLNTGWGVIKTNNEDGLDYIMHGTIKIKGISIPNRLANLQRELKVIIPNFLDAPCETAIEEIFLNSNPSSTIKLGMARGVILLTLEQSGFLIGEYPANRVKKSVVGFGHATKNDVSLKVRQILKKCPKEVNYDASDALAVAICHAYHRGFLNNNGALGET